MKKNSFINKEAVKYWKREAAKGNLRIARDGESVYIVNGYCAFVIPADNAVYNRLVSPAVNAAMPEDGFAHIWTDGYYRKEKAAQTVSLVNKFVSEAIDKAEISSFSVSLRNADCRIYKTRTGLAAIQEVFNCMINHYEIKSCFMNGTNSPAVIHSKDGQIALFMPMYAHDLENRIKSLLR